MPNNGIAHNGLKNVARFAAASVSLFLLTVSAVPETAQAAIRCGSSCYASLEACATATPGCGAGTSCAACEGSNCTSVPSCDNTTTNAPTAPTAPPPRRTSLVNPLGSGVTIQTLVGRAVRGVLGLSGSFALLMFVYGGFMWVTSGGNVDKVKKGKQIFTYAAIGLIVMFGAYAFLSFFINTLGAST